MNVHTLSSLREDDRRREEAGLLTDQESYGSGRSSELGSSRSFPIKFIELLFPNLKLMSFTTLLSVVLWTMYIVTLFIHPDVLLVPSGRTLFDFKANVPPLIQKGDISRLICPIFLHANFVHIFFNVFFLMRIAFTIERKYGHLLFLVLFLVCGIYGNIFTAASIFCDSMKVGASTSVFGLIGLQMSELLLTWHLIQHRDRVLANIVFFIPMMLLFALTINGGVIDQMGHLGGFICGFSMGILYQKDMEQKPSWYKVAVGVAIFLLIALPSTCLPIIFAIDRHC